MVKNVIHSFSNRDFGSLVCSGTFVFYIYVYWAILNNWIDLINMFFMISTVNQNWLPYKVCEITSHIQIRSFTARDSVEITITFYCWILYINCCARSTNRGIKPSDKALPSFHFFSVPKLVCTQCSIPLLLLGSPAVQRLYFATVPSDHIPLASLRRSERPIQGTPWAGSKLLIREITKLCLSRLWMDTRLAVSDKQWSTASAQVISHWSCTRTRDNCHVPASLLAHLRQTK